MHMVSGIVYGISVAQVYVCYIHVFTYKGTYINITNQTENGNRWKRNEQIRGLNTVLF